MRTHLDVFSPGVFERRCAKSRAMYTSSFCPVKQVYMALSAQPPYKTHIREWISCPRQTTIFLSHVKVQEALRYSFILLTQKRQMTRELIFCRKLKLYQKRYILFFCSYVLRISFISTTTTTTSWHFSLTLWSNIERERGSCKAWQAARSHPSIRRRYHTWQENV